MLKVRLTSLCCRWWFSYRWINIMSTFDSSRFLQP